MLTFHYSATIRENQLDSFGHVNNAIYLILFEEARWDIIHERGYDLQSVMQKRQGPVVLEINIRFQKELRARDKIVIETACTSYEGKIAKLTQTLTRGDQTCCVAVVTMGLFDLNERRLLAPTPEWLQAMGINDKLATPHSSIEARDTSHQ